MTKKHHPLIFSNIYKDVTRETMSQASMSSNTTLKNLVTRTIAMPKIKPMPMMMISMNSWSQLLKLTSKITISKPLAPWMPKLYQT